MLRENFARNLKHQRERCKITQAELAEEAGFHVSYISMLERGIRSPPLETIEALAEWLTVSPLALLKE